ncbi:MAG: hypothetical protein AAF458_05660 [Pseudomonadota bacterium]
MPLISIIGIGPLTLASARRTAGAQREEPGADAFCYRWETVRSGNLHHLYPPMYHRARDMQGRTQQELAFMYGSTLFDEAAENRARKVWTPWFDFDFLAL